MSIGGHRQGHDLWPEIGRKRSVPDDFQEPNDRKRNDRDDKVLPYWRRSVSPPSPSENHHGPKRQRRIAGAENSVSG